MGFPSPAKDYEEKAIDLNSLVIKNPSSTYFFKVKTDAMNGDGIFVGAIAVIDRSLTARHNDIVIAVMHGEFLVRRLQINENGNFLIASNPLVPVIKIEEELNVWGVIAAIIHNPNNIGYVCLS